MNPVVLADNGQVSDLGENILHEVEHLLVGGGLDDDLIGHVKAADHVTKLPGIEPEFVHVDVTLTLAQLENVLQLGDAELGGGAVAVDVAESRDLLVGHLGNGAVLVQVATFHGRMKTVQRSVLAHVGVHFDHVSTLGQRDMISGHGVAGNVARG